MHCADLDRPGQRIPHPPCHSGRTGRSEVHARYLRSGKRYVRKRTPRQIAGIVVSTIQKHERMNRFDEDVCDGFGPASEHGKKQPLAVHERVVRGGGQITGLHIFALGIGPLSAKGVPLSGDNS